MLPGLYVIVSAMIDCPQVNNTEAQINCGRFLSKGRGVAVDGLIGRDDDRIRRRSPRDTVQRVGRDILNV